MAKKKKADIDLSAQITKELNKAIDDMNLFDDDLMSLVFENNIPATELLLKIILERDDIKVISSKGQEDLRNPYQEGRNIRLDIRAKDSKGVEFDVEVQRNETGSDPRRARFHGSMLDSRMLKKNQDFKDIKDAYVIFICQHDKFKSNLPIYHVEKTVKETGESYEDGAHVIYVNGLYKGDDAFGKLAHDFNCIKADEIFYEPLAKGVKHFKETEEGRDIMCESFSRLADKVADERSEQDLIKYVKLMMKNMKCTLEDALNALEIKGKERTIIAKQLQK